MKQVLNFILLSSIFLIIAYCAFEYSEQESVLKGEVIVNVSDHSASFPSKALKYLESYSMPYNSSNMKATIESAISEYRLKLIKILGAPFFLCFVGLYFNNRKVLYVKTFLNFKFGQSKTDCNSYLKELVFQKKIIMENDLYFYTLILPSGTALKGQIILSFDKFNCMDCIKFVTKLEETIQLEEIIQFFNMKYANNNGKNHWIDERYSIKLTQENNYLSFHYLQDKITEKKVKDKIVKTSLNDI